MTGRRAGMVWIEDIRAHPTNIRRDLGDLRPLAASIRRDGVMVPLILERRGDVLQLRDGHRRLAAASMAGLDKVPAIIHTDALPDPEWLRHAVTVNAQRREQNNQERRETIRRMRERGVPVISIADAYGVTPETVSRWLNPTPRKPRTPATVSRAKVAQFITEWRDRSDDRNVAEVLDALEDLIGGQP